MQINIKDKILKKSNVLIEFLDKLSKALGGRWDKK